jgi:cyclopropane fatty-acyl-phospholipid synthase-like methyltransferase
MTPGIEDIRKFYDSWVDYLAVERSRHRMVYSHLDRYIRPGSSVLDIGCGTGLTSRHIASHKCKVVGVDLSPSLIDFAKSRNNGFDIEYVVADIAHWDDPRKFDYIVMVDVAEHILPDSVGDLMSVLNRVSHPDTVLLLHIPKKIANSVQPVDVQWSMGDVESAFGRAGFVPILFDGRVVDYALYIMTRRERTV